MAYTRTRQQYRKPEVNEGGEEPDKDVFDGPEDEEDTKPQRKSYKKTPVRGGKEKSPFINLTRLFPSKSGNSYTVFVNDTVRSNIMNFLEEAVDSDLLGITLGEDGGCRFWAVKGDK